MKASELKAFCEQDEILNHHLVGIFARNTVPPLCAQHCFAIVNTEDEAQPGRHWRLCMRPDRATLEVFDPLGWKPEHETLFQNSKVLQGVSRVVLSETQYQSSTSVLCGSYCLFVAHHRLYNLDLSLSSVLSDIFTDNLQENDRLVTEFVASQTPK